MFANWDAWLQADTGDGGGVFHEALHAFAGRVYFGALPLGFSLANLLVDVVYSYQNIRPGSCMGSNFMHGCCMDDAAIEAHVERSMADAQPLPELGILSEVHRFPCCRHAYIHLHSGPVLLTIMFPCSTLGQQYVVAVLYLPVVVYPSLSHASSGQYPCPRPALCSVPRQYPCPRPALCSVPRQYPCPRPALCSVPRQYPCLGLRPTLCSVVSLFLSAVYMHS